MIAVIGAGIVGANVAYALAARGEKVVLIDRCEPGAECSSGNSAAISHGSVVPLAMPGSIFSAPKMLLDPDGPLRIAPSYFLHALPWLLRFAASARPARVDEVANTLHWLNRGIVEAHQALARDIGSPELVAHKGHLYLYPSESAVAGDAAGWRIRERFGIAVERLDAQGIAAAEPAVNTSRYPVGLMLPGNAMVTNPQRYTLRIVEAFVARGGRVLRDEIRGLESDGHGGWALRGAQAAHAAARVVIAAGIWSRALLAGLGIRVPLESQRGYHAQFDGSASLITRTVVLADRKAFVAPLETGMRIAGTVEIAGLERPPNMHRARLLARYAREAFKGLDAREPGLWMGHRPCFPDYLPAIGESVLRPGLWVAIGHGHLGVTHSVVTGRLIADAMIGGIRPPELAAVSLERFS